MGASASVVVSCEHASARIPEAYRSLFEGAQWVVQSHRGWDAGALSLAKALASELRAPLFAGTHTRLLVDLNRSAHNPGVFSSYSRKLPRRQREQLLAQWHTPHWCAVRERVARELCRGPVLHVAVHSFTPTWESVPRRADVGVLYDPSREAERDAALGLVAALEACAPQRCVRRNYPYRGVSDGLTRGLREELADDDYLGIELEVNQRVLTAGARAETHQWIRSAMTTWLREREVA